ncbi:hypothetical protein L2E82_30991 [Cichorium intybus]|uniref:Uncharacterized protein n=1 Tax=Cichorium intybus TaxID=13427 RepID=A0ACB9D297_CICIN|nr:hypothetical protein L2E82_30991 [Cichorium intybus]
MLLLYIMADVMGHGGDGAGDPPIPPWRGPGRHGMDGVLARRKTRGKAKNLELQRQRDKSGRPLTLEFDRAAMYTPVGRPYDLFVRECNFDIEALEKRIEQFRKAHTRKDETWDSYLAYRKYIELEREFELLNDPSPEPSKEVGVFEKVLGSRRGHYKGIVRKPLATATIPPHFNVGQSSQEAPTKDALAQMLEDPRHRDIEMRWQNFYVRTRQSKVVERARVPGIPKMATTLAGTEDLELLRLLSKICNKEEISIGYSFSKNFWKRFAELLSTKVDHRISSSECIRAAKQHNMIYEGNQIICLFYLLTKFYGFAVSIESVLIFCDLRDTPQAIRHPTSKNAEYRTLLHSIYRKVPRLLYPSESGTCSGGPIRSRSSKTCSTSSGMRREDWTDEWKALEPKLYNYLGSLLDTNQLKFDDLDKVAAHFKIYASSSALKIFLEIKVPTKKLEMI